MPVGIIIIFFAKAYRTFAVS